MNQIHEFKAELLDKVFAAWNAFVMTIPANLWTENDEGARKIEFLQQIWNDYHTLEARLE